MLRKNLRHLGSKYHRDGHDCSGTNYSVSRIVNFAPNIIDSETSFLLKYASKFLSRCSFRFQFKISSNHRRFDFQNFVKLLRANKIDCAFAKKKIWRKIKIKNNQSCAIFWKPAKIWKNIGQSLSRNILATKGIEKCS